MAMEIANHTTTGFVQLTVLHDIVSWPVRRRDTSSLDIWYWPRVMCYVYFGEVNYASV
jgi:hypothetical protein